MELTHPQPKFALAAPAALAAVFIAIGALGPLIEIPSNDTILATIKLLAASAIGYLIASVQRRTDSSTRGLEHAQILLCLAGALVVMLIGDSLARAVGIIGGASLIRFRTPIDDPKDATVLFLLLGLGMATGLGHFGVAGLATMFLAILLLSFGRAIDGPKHRTLSLQLVFSRAGLPASNVESVLRRHAVSFEPREITNGERPVIRYQVSLDAAVPLATVSQELLDDGVHSLSWDTPKKERVQ